MNSKQVRITLDQLVEWGEKSPGLKFHKHTPENYIKLMEDFPPPQVFDQVRPTVIEEKINVNNIQLLVLDESTDTEYDYNPNLDIVFG